MASMTAATIASEPIVMFKMTMLAPMNDTTTKHGDNATITALQIATRNKMLEVVDLANKEDIITHDLFSGDHRRGLGGYAMNTKESFTNYFITNGTIVEFTSP